MNSNFQQLKDDSAVFHGGINRFRLQPGFSLSGVSLSDLRIGAEKSLTFCGCRWRRFLDIPIHVGKLCIRIFADADNLLAAKTTKPSAV